MTWSISDAVAFVTLIIAIPTSVVGVWTLFLHLQRSQRARQARLFYTASGTDETDPSTEHEIPLLQQRSPLSLTPTPLPPTITTLHPALTVSTPPGNNPEFQTAADTMQYSYFIYSGRLHVNRTSTQPLSPTDADPRSVQEV
ncbi:hypothetical protein BJY01DRAFT_214758 [Aspergillus pseudoustus]|uniref:Uncharacterized protein n=1 Tax=Aspergillus pseudoustus TaxID=1810923 RepID=A0ABR4JXG7_9EURO